MSEYEKGWLDALDEVETTLTAYLEAEVYTPECNTGVEAALRVIRDRLTKPPPQGL